MSTTVILAILAAAAIVAALVFGREQVWTLVGPADQGAVDFAGLARRTSPNEALIAPPGFTAARVDREAPVFDMPAAALRARLTQVALADGSTTQVAADGLRARFVQRTPLMRWPDTIDTLVIDLGEGRSTLALWSRSLVGYSDLGANRARLERWLDRLR